MILGRRYEKRICHVHKSLGYTLGVIREAGYAQINVVHFEIKAPSESKVQLLAAKISQIPSPFGVTESEVRMAMSTPFMVV